VVKSGDMGATGAAQAGQPLRRPVGLGEEVYNAIFGRLMSLQIAPGERLSIDALARDLGVSPTPVREAMSRLESEGLVHKTHLVGYRASSQLTRKQFEDLYDLRLLLEPYIAAKAAENISSDQLATLRGLMVEMAGEERALDYGRFAQLDKLFHDEIARAAGNEIVEEALSRLHTHVHLFRLMSDTRVTGEALVEHAALIDAFERGDAGAAADLMRGHIEKSRRRLMATL
jgi:DNA-binding GntR family transcriptional regulator